jgi:hypothetical protein
MIVFNKELLFVHNPKTAGTSLLRYLGSALPGPVYYAGVAEIGTNHTSLSRALDYSRAKTGNKSGDFKRIISAIRNPYDREISMYIYFRDVLCHSASVSKDLNDPEIERIVHKAGQLSFREYLMWLQHEIGTCDIWRSRYFYRTENEEPLPNLRVIKVESLESDLAIALEGVELRSSCEPLPHLNATSRRPVDIYEDRCSVDFVTHHIVGFSRRGITPLKYDREARSSL